MRGKLKVTLGGVSHDIPLTFGTYCDLLARCSSGEAGITAAEVCARYLVDTFHSKGAKIDADLEKLDPFEVAAAAGVLWDWQQSVLKYVDKTISKNQSAPAAK